MGKKSLTKSTTSTKKKGTTKKTTGAAAGKNTKAKKTETKKTARKPSLKTLRKRKFEAWSPENPYTPKPLPGAEENFTAPELTRDYAPADAERIRTLLFRQIDLSAPEQKPSQFETITNSQEKKPEKAGQKHSSENKGTGGKDRRPPEPPGPPGDENCEPPISSGLLGLIVAVILIFALLIGASLNNMDNYYLKQTNTGLEIWRGDFSPNGRQKIVTLQGVDASEPIKNKYSRQEALAAAFEYFMEKADKVAEAKDLPNLNIIRDNLGKAKKYAVTEEQKKHVNKRLNRIDFLMLLYRSDVAAEKQTEQGYETAMEILKQAEDLELAESDRQIQQQKISRLQDKLEKLRQESGDTDGSK